MLHSSPVSPQPTPQTAPRFTRGGLLAVVLTCLVAPPVFLLALEAMGLRVWSVDFFAYRYAVETALRGQDFYTTWVSGPMLEDGLPYNYTPFAILPLLPAALSPWWLAYGMWSIATVAAVVVSVVLACPEVTRRWWTLPLVTLVLMTTEVLAHHLMFGQVNAFLMAACLLDFWLMSRGRRGGLLIGAATAVKLTPGLFIVFLLLLGRWRDALRASLAAAACTLAGLVLFPQQSVVFWTDSFWHLSDRVDLNGVFATGVNKSVQGFFAMLSPDLALLGKAVMVLLVGACLWLAVRLSRRGEMVIGALAVGVGTTLASPVSWVHHWVYLLPMLVLLAARGGRAVRAVCALAYVVFTGVVWAEGFLAMALALTVLLGVLFARAAPKNDDAVAPS